MGVNFLMPEPDKGLQHKQIIQDTHRPLKLYLLVTFWLY